MTCSTKPAFLAAVLLIAGCQEPAQPGESRGSTTPRYERPEAGAPLDPSARPVRIGESGPSFAACATNATTRTRAAEPGGTLTVRSAPAETAPQLDRLPAGSTFFVCARSIDQSWLGIVYDGDGAVSERCGVSRPVPSRRDYEGPCSAGWVASASVKLIASRPDA